jgi:hypothetical protein
MRQEQQFSCSFCSFLVWRSKVEGEVTGCGIILVVEN